MSSFALEILGPEHDRAGFSSGRDSVDRYLKEIARGHQEKGISVTRVLVPADARAPKPVAGFFTLSGLTVEAQEWPGAAKGLPNGLVPAVLLGRLAVASSWQGRGLGGIMVATARQITREALLRTGGIGMVVDAADESVVRFYQKFGFRRVSENALRLFLPAASLEGGDEIGGG